MSISQTTIGEATSVAWNILWRSMIWGICVGCTAWAFGFEWSWRLGIVCIVSTTAGEALSRTSQLSQADQKT